ncbi:hypothetical protein C9374_012458 [Naegleria lovaniensis]|uniref:Exonuclease domain-containing protein n=1 Tax=Naegleria lovaniensis TaxID=51637 RepID=A0AA88H145_NAELO|nr:uncharacterized protein C9374_012458 [Naegleria lovaniensis]KAG2392206.1 hypothetical protein C9374_012458 [Naegleria lovaniensis]
MNSTPSSSSASPSFDYYLILDFEATCDDKIKNFRNEIIEFPTLAINARTLQTDFEFHYYVKPKENKILTQFCKELTGIQQEWVDAGVEFETVMKLHNEWMMENFINKNLKFAFVTCGDWDLKTMITKQCRKEQIKVPSYFSSWTNLKKVYSKLFNKSIHGMTCMLQDLKLDLIGRHHSGIDDCRNIGRVVVELLKQGKPVNITSKIEDFENEWKNKKNKK